METTLTRARHTLLFCQIILDKINRPNMMVLVYHQGARPWGLPLLSRTDSTRAPPRAQHPRPSAAPTPSLQCPKMSPIVPRCNVRRSRSSLITPRSSLPGPPPGPTWDLFFMTFLLPLLANPGTAQHFRALRAVTAVRTSLIRVNPCASVVPLLICVHPRSSAVPSPTEIATLPASRNYETNPTP